MSEADVRVKGRVLSVDTSGAVTIATVDVPAQLARKREGDTVDLPAMMVRARMSKRMFDDGASLYEGMRCELLVPADGAPSDRLCTIIHSLDRPLPRAKP
jgi:hypothetical protein